MVPGGWVDAVGLIFSTLYFAAVHCLTRHKKVVASNVKLFGSPLFTRYDLGMISETHICIYSG